MRSSRALAFAVAAVVLGPLLATGSAYADPTSPPPTGSDAGYQDVQLPPDPADNPDASSVPLPFSPGENRMVADFQAKKLTASQFVALGISGSIGGPLPPKYQDHPGDDQGDRSGGDGDHDGDDEGRGREPSDDDTSDHRHGDESDSDGRSDDPDAAGAQAAGPVDGPSPTPSDTSTAASDTPAAPSGDSSAASEFLNYVFAVGASDPAASNLLASVFEPTPVTDDGSAPAPAEHGALALAPAAVPNDPQCLSPTQITISGVLSILKDLVPGPLLKKSFPTRVVFACEMVINHFHVYYTLASKDKTNGVADQARDPRGVPVYIDHVGAALENAYSYYTRLGYKEPPGPVTVLISSFWGAMHNGAAFTPPPVASHQFIVMDNNYSEFYLPTHELFHTFQYRYIAVAKYITPGRFEDMNWWMEATAEWAAHRAMASSTSSFVDLAGQNERTWYDQKLPVFLGEPGQRLDDWTGLGGQTRQYGSFIFAEFLADDFGTAAILHTWQHIGSENGHLGSDYLGAGTYPIHAIKETLAGYGTDFATQLPIFAKAVYQLGPDDACLMPSIVTAAPTLTPSTTLKPASICYGYYSSYQFQFNDPDLGDWIFQLANDKRTKLAADDPAPGSVNTRPKHQVVALNTAGASGNHLTYLNRGGMYFADLTWAGYPYQDLAVTVSAPKHTNFHVSLIGWTTYRQRCGYDQDADVPAGGSVTIQSAPIDTCAFATLIITQTSPDDSQSNDITHVAWSTRYVSPPIYY